jgi:hypothetical protein
LKTKLALQACKQTKGGVIVAKNEEKKDAEVELIAEEVPGGTTRPNKYRQILEQFAEAGVESVRIQSDAHPATLFQQLNKVKKADAPQWEGVKVLRREGVVYLTKIGD